MKTIYTHDADTGLLVVESMHEKTTLYHLTSALFTGEHGSRRARDVAAAIRSAEEIGYRVGQRDALFEMRTKIMSMERG